MSRSLSKGRGCKLDASSGRYTKRALLSGVIAATELYMLTDFSPGYADTWAALDRRLRDVSQLGKAASQACPAVLSLGMR